MHRRDIQSQLQSASVVSRMQQMNLPVQGLSNRRQQGIFQFSSYLLFIFHSYYSTNSIRVFWILQSKLKTVETLGIYIFNLQLRLKKVLSLKICGYPQTRHRIHWYRFLICNTNSVSLLLTRYSRDCIYFPFILVITLDFTELSIEYLKLTQCLDPIVSP